MRPDEFLRSYRTWLLQFNDLRDIAFLRNDRNPVRAFSNSELEAFRTHPKLPWVEREGTRALYRVYRPGVLSYRILSDHLSQGRDCTCWMTNSQKHHRLLLLRDSWNRSHESISTGKCSSSLPRAGVAGMGISCLT